MSDNLLAGIVSILSTHGRSVGTGFVVAAEGLVATCAHVVRAAGADPGADVSVRFYHGEEKRRAQVVATWWRAPHAADVAILRLQGSLPAGAGPLPLGPAAGTTGHPVYAFGFPSLGTLEGLWGRGEVLGLVSDAGRSLLQLRSSEITTGFSGGPVWDEETELVIGMATSIARPDPDGRLGETAFATPAEVLQQVCPDLRLMPAPDRPTSTSGDRQTIERALAMARRSLNILEEQAAAFGKLHIPAHLQIELEEKRREVTDLQARLNGPER